MGTDASSDEQQLAVQGRTYKELRDRRSRVATITVQLRSYGHLLSRTASLVTEFLADPAVESGIPLAIHLDEQPHWLGAGIVHSLINELLKETDAIKTLEADIAKF